MREKGMNQSGGERGDRERRGTGQTRFVTRGYRALPRRAAGITRSYVTRMLFPRLRPVVTTDFCFTLAHTKHDELS